MANSAFFKTLSKSIYTGNVIKGGGQGGLKRKNFWPQVSVKWYYTSGHTILMTRRYPLDI